MSVARTLAIDSHTETDMARMLLEKFPATAWLIGSDAVIRAAEAFISQRTLPGALAAEYGIDFPVFLAARDTGATRTYLRLFAELDWHWTSSSPRCRTNSARG
jgi:hypothetical protein